MGLPAAGALQAADAQRNGTVSLFHVSGIIAMDVKAGGMAAGTGKLVELDACHQAIIKILGNRIAKISRKGYHKHADSDPKRVSAGNCG